MKLRDSEEPLRCGIFGIITNHPTPHERIVRRISQACKSYLRQVSGKPRQCISKRPCPYEDCGCDRIWFWGWYERKEGCLPLNDGGEVAGPVPLRRFMCTGCGRTFSWRPAFLLFGHRYAAVFYQLAFKRWSRGTVARASGSWYDLSASAHKAFARFMSSRACDLVARLGSGCDDLLPGHHLAEPPPPGEVWLLARRAVRALLPVKRPPLSIHLTCLALVRHKHAAIYRLDSL